MSRILGTLLFLALLSSLVGLLLRRAFPEAWKRWLSRVFLGACGFGGLSFGLWILGRTTGSWPIYLVGLSVTGAILVSVFLLFVTSPLWAGGAALTRNTNGERRRFLRGAVAAVPTASAGAGPLGAAAAMMQPVLRRVPVRVDGLPEGLRGLKILQLTDVHLGTFIDVAQVEQAIELARAEAPDLVVLTGDIADDYDKLPPALAAIESLNPPLGVFAVYGNHEVYRGRRRAAEIYAQSKVRLLCEDGVTLSRGDASLYVCGADDPATLGREHRDFLARTVKKALSGAPDEAKVRIVLSHRPEGFEEATRQGATLTLSGHTHGAQVAVFGRSLFEHLMPRSYLLGHYERDGSHLYTSAGLGHWFPFRLNCPCEVGLIELV